MPVDNYKDILAFIAVAQARSFTRAALKLGVSQSALSHTIRGLEAKLGLRLLTRTTRSVSPTEAGQRLIERVGPRFDIIAQELAAFDGGHRASSGTVRITTSDFAFQTVLLPRLASLRRVHPDIRIDVSISSEFVDIVSGQFDAGIRFGDAIAPGMTAVRISPDIRMVIVATPGYFDTAPRPETPADLTRHDCINLRFAPNVEPYLWELKKGKRTLQVKVTGSWTFNAACPALDATLAGVGLAYMPEALARPYISEGQLVSVLDDWCPTFPGLHIYYANRHDNAALALIVAELARADRALG